MREIIRFISEGYLDLFYVVYLKFLFMWFNWYSYFFRDQEIVELSLEFFDLLKFLYSILEVFIGDVEMGFGFISFYY